MKTGKTYTLDCTVERMSDEDKVDEFFRQSVLWKSVLHGVESNAGQAVYGTLLRQAMFKKHHYFELEMVHHKNRKVDRIRAALRPRYASGYMVHRTEFSRLEQQLFDFRYDDSHEHDDGPDSVAACIVLLDPTAAFNAESDPGENQFIDDELDENYDEDLAVSGDFNWAS